MQVHINLRVYITAANAAAPAGRLEAARAMYFDKNANFRLILGARPDRQQRRAGPLRHVGADFECLADNDAVKRRQVREIG
jgi:hypothetical protein